MTFNTGDHPAKGKFVLRRSIKMILRAFTGMTVIKPKWVDRYGSFAKTIKKHGAYRRQMQYIGALMRKIDLDPIKKALEVIEFGDYHKEREFKKIEKCRDELIEGNDALLEEIIVRMPEAERQRLTQLVRNARKEKENNKSPRSSKMLFRYLRQVSENADDRHASAD